MRPSLAVLLLATVAVVSAIRGSGKYAPEAIKVGSRVKRGPDWKWVRYTLSCSRCGGHSPSWIVHVATVTRIPPRFDCPRPRVDRCDNGVSCL